MNALASAAQSAGKRYERELATVINLVTTRTKKRVSMGIRQELATSAKAVNDQLETSTRAKPGALRRTVTIKYSSRIPLKDFGANQKKKGVSYKISKTKGRQTIPSAFIVRLYGDNVFQRRGKARPVGSAKKGASPWGVFVKRKQARPIRKEVRSELIKEIKRRTKFLNLKASGAI